MPYLIIINKHERDYITTWSYQPLQDLDDQAEISALNGTDEFFFNQFKLNIKTGLF